MGASADDASTAAGRYEFFDLKPRPPDIAAEVLHGLRGRRKFIPPKYFYDARGSRLFDAITRLPEYYLTRTEIAILHANRDAIAHHVAADAGVLEYGSGSSVKVRILLDACRPAAYVPVDISKDHLAAGARAVANDYPALSVYPVCADYTAAFPLPPPVAALRRMAFFPGSSIGNFDPEAAQAFLAAVAHTVGLGGALIVGVDAKKNTEVLDRAYNDAAGLTARFNRNLLRHVNDAIGANFDPHGFEHRAEYNEDAGRIEMYLDAKRDQVVAINGERVAFAEGESLHTENSYKYTPEEFVALAATAGFACEEMWQDARRYFTVLLLRTVGDAA